MTGYCEGGHFHGTHPREETERLKKEVALERLVLGFGVELKRHGAALLGRCSFHEDKTPSLVVSPKTNLWHCLGKCNEGGATIDWVMKTKGVSFRHAVELLKADHSSFFFSRWRPSLAAGDARVVKKGTTAKLETPVKAEADEQEALQQVVEFYHQTLKDYFGARYMSAAQGRFTNPDPIWVKADRFVDPQRLNRSEYDRNNPPRFTDPTGMDSEIGECGIGGAPDCYRRRVLSRSLCFPRVQLSVCATSSPVQR
ncbi:MAG: hypothetical protein INH43_24000 [Acidobacteriaceae bacterium]|nr:hypothetical protein [Acidobacteriaceae bacterium]